MLRKHLKDSSHVLNKALVVPATTMWYEKVLNVVLLPYFMSTLTQSPELGPCPM